MKRNSRKSPAPISKISKRPMPPPKPWPRPPNSMLPSSPPRAKPAIPPINPPIQPREGCGAGAQVFLQDLARRVLRQRRHELDPSRHLVVRDGGAAERLQLLRARAGALVEDH